MRIFIDADGCPVVDIAVKIARQNDIECIILCDTSHTFNKDGAKTITVSKGADSVDFKLVNMLEQGDIVITQDYGLAAICLARGAVHISQDGMVYNNDNIDALLLQRHTAKKIRMSGGRLKGNSKRTEEQNIAFEDKLKEIVGGRKFMNVIYSNTLSVDDYCKLRKSVGWYDIPESVVKQALEKSGFIVSAVVDGITVGMARLMTDGTQILIMDVAVHPDYQGRGVGKELMEHIKRHIETTYDKMLVSLTTDDKNVGFYEKLGFCKITGMRLWHGIK